MSTQNVDLVEEKVVDNVARSALFVALTSVFAYISFTLPITPVPYTLQVLGVFLTGIFLGPRWGAAAMTLYVVAGAVGLPVYAYGASGLGTLLGQWGGYLWSYPIAAGVIGLAVHGTDDLIPLDQISLVRLTAGLVAGTAIIYAFGTVSYAVVGDVGLYRALFVAAVPFIPGEILKAAIAVGVTRSERLADYAGRHHD